MVNIVYCFQPVSITHDFIFLLFLCDFVFRSSLGHLPLIAQWISQNETKTILTTVLTQFVCHILSYFFLHAFSVQRYNIFLTYARKIKDFRFGRLIFVFLCVSVLSRFSPAHRLVEHKTRRGIRWMPLLIITRTRGITTLCRAFSSSSCNATERSPERRRRARLPLSGTVLLQKRNEPHPSGSLGTYPTAALWSRAGTGSCLLPRAAGCNARGASNRTQQPSPPQPGTCPYLLSDRG